MPNSPNYRLVKLASGVHSVHSVAHEETFHPVVGPVAEAEALYVRQLRLRERLEKHEGEFVIWDVGLGAAANPITVLRAVHEIPARARIISFEQTLEPLEFALAHADTLGYVSGYEERLQSLLTQHATRFRERNIEVNWEV